MVFYFALLWCKMFVRFKLCLKFARSLQACIVKIGIGLLVLVQSF